MTLVVVWDIRVFKFVTFNCEQFTEFLENVQSSYHLTVAHVIRECW